MLSCFVRASIHRPTVEKGFVESRLKTFWREDFKNQKPVLGCRRDPFTATGPR
jgi:hypothetical protein